MRDMGRNFWDSKGLVDRSVTYRQTCRTITKWLNDSVTKISSVKQHCHFHKRRQIYSLYIFFPRISRYQGHCQLHLVLCSDSFCSSSSMMLRRACSASSSSCCCLYHASSSCCRLSNSTRRSDSNDLHHQYISPKYTGYFRKKVAPLKVFKIFSLRLSFFVSNFANLLAIHSNVYLPIFVDLT